MLATLLTALVLSPAAMAEPPPGGCTYDPASENPKVDFFRQGGVTTTTVFADDQCDGKVGTEGCATTEGKAFGGLIPHCPGTVSASFTAEDGGPDLPDAESSTLIRQKSFFQSAAFKPNAKATDRVLSVGIDGDGGTVKVKASLSAEAWEDGSWDESTTDAFTVATRLVRNDDGTAYIEAKLQGLDKEAELWPYTTGSVSSDGALDEDGNTSVDLGLARTKGKVKTKHKTSDGSSSDGFSYSYALKLPDGESKEGTVTVTDGTTVGLVKTKVKQKRNGDLKVVSWTMDDTAGGDNAFDVAVYDADGAEVLMVLGDTPAFTASYFESGSTQSFDGSPVGTGYGFTLTANVGGTASDETWDVFTSFDEDSGTIDLSDWGLVDAGALVYELDGTDLSWTLATTGGKTSDIGSIELVFNEPFEGPSPQETVETFSFSREVHKWVQTASLSDAQAAGELTGDIIFYEGEEEVVAYDTWIGQVDEVVLFGLTVDSATLNVVKAVKSATGLGL